MSFQFAEDKRTERDEVSSLYGAGLMSLSTAVDRLDHVDDVEGEVDKINKEHMDAATELQEGERQQAGEVKPDNTKSDFSDERKTGDGDKGEEKLKPCVFDNLYYVKNATQKAIISQAHYGFTRHLNCGICGLLNDAFSASNKFKTLHLCADTICGSDIDCSNRLVRQGSCWSCYSCC